MLHEIQWDMNAKRVVIKGLNYVGYVIDYGAVFCTVRLLSGTLMFVPRNLIQVMKERTDSISLQPGQKDYPVIRTARCRKGFCKSVP
jgi:hypothetical protein